MRQPAAAARGLAELPVPRSRTDGVDSNGAAAKVRNSDFDRLGKKVHPGTLGEDKSRSTGVPKKFLCQMSKHMQFAVTPLVLTPFVPFQVPLEAAVQARDEPWRRQVLPMNTTTTTATTTTTTTTTTIIIISIISIIIIIRQRSTAVFEPKVLLITHRVV